MNARIVLNARTATGWLCGAALLAWVAGGCASAPPPETAPDPGTERAEEVRHLLHGTSGGAWASTYRPLPSRPTLIRGATVMTAAGEEIEGGDVLLRDGEIVAVGRDLEAPADAEVIDAAGRWVTPGLIDTHSHLGVFGSPRMPPHSDGNEMTDPNTAEVWAEHSLWPQDPGFTRALAGGVTTAQLLPGSANLIGGRGVTVRTLPARTAQGMMFPDAPRGLKMACGENPKRVYGGRDQAPSTRMGNVAGYREAFIAAQRYRDEWHEWAENGDGDPPRRDLALESLAEVLRGEILVHNHCYRADEMAHMLDLAREFGFRIRSFHHGVEAYKVRDLLARDTVAASVWTDWWGFKMEAFDTVNENLGLLSEAGVKAVLHSDSDLGIQILNQDAARAMHAARAAGIEVTRDEALRWITANPAWAVGLEDRTGTLEPGKAADVVVWSGDPFRVYSRADQVFMDGALVYDRFRPELRPVTDFELGILGDWPAAGTGADEAHAPARPPRGSRIAAPDARARAAEARAQASDVRARGSEGRAQASDVRAARARDAGDVAIVGGEVHTVSGDVIPGGTVLILDGQISAVGPDVAVPEGVRRIDAAGKVVTPGLFDAGTQMGLVEVGLEAQTRDAAMDDDAVRAAFDVLDGVNPNSLAIAVKRLTGVTTVLSAPSGGLISGQAAVLDLRGGSLGGMLVRPRAAMMARYGAGAAAQAGGARGGASLRLREVLEDARFWRENRNAFDRGAARPLAGSRLDLEALQPVLAGDVPLVVDVDRASDILAVLRIAGEYDLRLVVSGGAEAWMVADSLAEAGVPVVLRPLTNLPGSFDRLGSRFDNAAALHRAGVTVGISTFTTHDRGTLGQEAGNAVRFGLPWEEALRAVTLTPARALGVADLYGSLEPGKVGNVVVWTGDPFDLSSRAETVVIRGEVMPDVSRQRELLERYRTLEEDRPPAYRPGVRGPSGGG